MTLTLAIAVQARAELPKELREARAARKLGLAVSTVLVGAALLASSGLRIGASFPESLGRSLGWGLCGLAGFAAITKAILGKRVLVEFHQGALYLQFDAPSEDGSPLIEGAVQVSAQLLLDLSCIRRKSASSRHILCKEVPTGRLFQRRLRT